MSDTATPARDPSPSFGIEGPALQVAMPGLFRMAIAPNGDLYGAFYDSTLLRISAGNYGGRLGPFHFHLHRLFGADSA